MNILRILAPTALTLALFALFASSAWAFPEYALWGERTMVEDSSLGNCNKHASNPKDCHIHDESTYLHVKGDVPESGNSHAWQEFRAWETHFRQRHQ